MWILFSVREARAAGTVAPSRSWQLRDAEVSSYLCICPKFGGCHISPPTFLHLAMQPICRILPRMPIPVRVPGISVASINERTQRPADDPDLSPAGYSGWGGIRTPGGISPTAVFKTAAIDHSATHPKALYLNALRHAFCNRCRSALVVKDTRGHARVIGWLPRTDNCHRTSVPSLPHGQKTTSRLGTVPKKLVSLA